MEDKLKKMYLENFTADFFFQNDSFSNYLKDEIEWKALSEGVILENIDEIKQYLKENYNDVETINIDEAITQKNKSVVNGEIFCKNNKIIYFCNIYTLEIADDIRIKSITTFIN